MSLCCKLPDFFLKVKWFLFVLFCFFGERPHRSNAAFTTFHPSCTPVTWFSTAADLDPLAEPKRWLSRLWGPSSISLSPPHPLTIPQSGRSHSMWLTLEEWGFVLSPSESRIFTDIMQIFFFLQGKFTPLSPINLFNRWYQFAHMDVFHTLGYKPILL